MASEAEGEGFCVMPRVRRRQVFNRASLSADADYAEYLRDKRVVLVGPAAYMHELGRGALIDSFDVIVRLNLDCPVRTDVFEQLYPDKTAPRTLDIGSRTDVLYHTVFDRRLSAAAGQEHTPQQAEAWREDGVQFIVTRYHHQHRRVRWLRRAVEDRIPIVSPREQWMLPLREEIGGSPNIGTVAIAHLLEQPIASLHVMGVRMTWPWEGYRVGYGGFDAEQALRGTGAGFWGQDTGMYLAEPHPHTAQVEYLRRRYHEDPRLTFDAKCASPLGLLEMPAVNAIVPIKQHSERLPGKNWRLLAGRPLLYWVLDALQAARHIDRVYVDTDSDEIAALVAEHRSRVTVLRKAEHRNANTIIRSLLPHLEGEHFLQTHVTSPLVSAETFDRAVEAYFESLEDGHDSLFTVTKHQSWYFDHSGRALNSDTASLQRSQDLDPIYEDNSAAHLFSRASFLRTGSRIGLSPAMHPIPKLEAVDIDYEEDFMLAEALMRARHA